MGRCIEFEGAKSKNDYGSKWNDSRVRYAHRIAWEEANTPLEGGEWVLHTCDNPPCINAEHLFVGDRTDNIRDMVAKGRHWSQQKTHCPQGHPLVEGNLDLAQLRKGYRQCITCRRRQTNAAQKRYMARKRKEAQN